MEASRPASGCWLLNIEKVQREVQFESCFILAREVDSVATEGARRKMTGSCSAVRTFGLLGNDLRGANRRRDPERSRDVYGRKM